MDDTTAFSSLTLPQQLNIIADTQAKEALLHGIKMNTATGPTYLSEAVQIFIDGKKATSSMFSALYASWGAHVTKKLFQQ
jgi:hypothetical protein